MFRLRFVLGMLLVAIAGCHSPPVDESSGNGLDKSASVEDVFVHYSEALSEPEAHPLAPVAIQKMLDAQKRISAEDPELALIYRYSDAPLGTYLFQQRLDRLSASAPEDARRIVAEALTRAPQTSVGAAALQYELARLREQSTDAFLTKCADTIAANPTGKSGRIALYERLQHYSQVGDTTKAAVDAAVFCARFPDTVDKAHLRLWLAARLSDGGYGLESAVVEKAKRLDPTMKYFGDEIVRAIDSHSVYISSPSSIEALRAGATTTEASFARALLEARKGFLEIRHADGPAAYASFSTFVDTVRSLLDKKALTEAECSFAAGIHEVTAQPLEALFGDLDNSGVRVGPRVKQRDADALLREYYRLRLDLEHRTLELAGQLSPEAFSERVKEHVERLTARHDYVGAVESYERIAADFPQSSTAQTALSKAAAILADKLSNRVAAEAMYDKIISIDADPRETQAAWIQKAASLYERERYLDAFDAAEDFLSKYPESPTAPNAKFLVALSESSMGQVDDGEAHMRALVSDYPQSNAAESGLFWLATQRLSRQDYDGANEFFSELVERFPASDKARRSKEYLDKLKTVTEAN